MKVNVSMKAKFFLFLVFSISNFTYASDDNSGLLASAAHLDSQSNAWQGIEIGSDEEINRLVLRTNNLIAEGYASIGMFIGTFTGFGTALVTTLTQREILHPAALVFLGVGSMAAQMGIGAYIGYRCKPKNNMRINGL
jgi:hypothetical protein